MAVDLVRSSINGAGSNTKVQKQPLPVKEPRVWGSVKAIGKFKKPKRTEGITTSDVIMRIPKDYNEYVGLSDLPCNQQLFTLKERNRYGDGGQPQPTKSLFIIT